MIILKTVGTKSSLKTSFTWLWFACSHTANNDNYKDSIIKIIIINNNDNNFPETRKYWVDVQWGIASSHGERDSL